MRDSEETASWGLFQKVKLARLQLSLALRAVEAAASTPLAISAACRVLQKVNKFSDRTHNKHRSPLVNTGCVMLNKTCSVLG